MDNRKIEYSKTYIKELSNLIKNNKVDTAELDKLLLKISKGESLESQYRDHQLAKHSPKEYQGCREFHYKPNICVVYKRTDDLVKLLRIGPHNKLGLTENIKE